MPVEVVVLLDPRACRRTQHEVFGIAFHAAGKPSVRVHQIAVEIERDLVIVEGKGKVVLLILLDPDLPVVEVFLLCLRLEPHLQNARPVDIGGQVPTLVEARMILRDQRLVLPVAGIVGGKVEGPRPLARRLPVVMRHFDGFVRAAKHTALVGQKHARRLQPLGHARGQLDLTGVQPLVRGIFPRARADRVAVHIPAVIAQMQLVAAQIDPFGLARRRHRLLYLVDGLDDAIGRRRVVDDVLFLDLVAMHDDIAEVILVMRAAVPLLGIERDDRSHVVVHPVAVAVKGHMVQLELRRVALDRDRVFSSDVIRDDVHTNPVDPVVMQALVLARDTHPVDGPVVLDMLEDDVLLGVDQRFELERVAACAADQNVIGLQFLIDPIDQLEVIAIHRWVRELPRWFADDQLPDPLLARVRAADQHVIAIAAHQQVVAAPAVERIVAVPAVQTVVAIAAQQAVGARTAL